MTKLFFFVAVLFISFSSFAQKPVEVNFCGKSASEISIRDLVECKTISTNHPDYKVFSFTVGFMSGKDIIDAKMTDNVISDKIITNIKETNPEMIYIEQIVLINKQGEKVSLEPFKVKR